MVKDPVNVRKEIGCERGRIRKLEERITKRRSDRSSLPKYINSENYNLQWISLIIFISARSRNIKLLHNISRNILSQIS